MQVLRSLELIRKRPEMYFPGGVTATVICSSLLDDALGLGAAHVSVDCVDRWHVVSADVDWLELPVHRVVPLERLFAGMYAHPKRINGVRAEVFVGAFAEAAYAATPGEIRAVVGDLVLPETVSRALCSAPYIRSVAFLFRSG